MRAPCLSLFSLALLCALSRTAAAQSAPIPDAPALAAPQHLNLTLPAAKYETPAPVEKPLVCGAPPSGIYTVENTMSPTPLLGWMKNYQANAVSRIYAEWSQNYKRIHQGSVNGGVVMLRVAVHADGSYAESEVVKSSGHPGEDAGAQQAVRDVVSFPPMPEGRNRPFVMCMNFGYERYKEEMQADEVRNEPWLDPKKTGAVPPKAKGKP